MADDKSEQTGQIIELLEAIRLELDNLNGRAEEAGSYAASILDELVNANGLLKELTMKE
jgi:hypothetical protein